MNTITSQGMTKEEMMKDARMVPAYYPERVREIFTGMAETSGLTYDDIAFLYYGPIFLLLSSSNPEPVPASCSYLAAWDNYTTEGSPVLSRNWDLAGSEMPLTEWSVLAMFAPTDAATLLAHRARPARAK